MAKRKNGPILAHVTDAGMVHIITARARESERSCGAEVRHLLKFALETLARNGGVYSDTAHVPITSPRRTKQPVRQSPA